MNKSHMVTSEIQEKSLENLKKYINSDEHIEETYIPNYGKAYFHISTDDSLDEKELKPNDYDPKTETVKTDIIDKATGKPTRQRFDIINHPSSVPVDPTDGERLVDSLSTPMSFNNPIDTSSYGVSMRTSDLSRKPILSNEQFKHEEGHLNVRHVVDNIDRLENEIAELKKSPRENANKIAKLSAELNSYKAEKSKIDKVFNKASDHIDKKMTEGELIDTGHATNPEELYADYYARSHNAKSSKNKTLSGALNSMNDHGNPYKNKNPYKFVEKYSQDGGKTNKDNDRMEVINNVNSSKDPETRAKMIGLNEKDKEIAEKVKNNENVDISEFGKTNAHLGNMKSKISNDNLANSLETKSRQEFIDKEFTESFQTLSNLEKLLISEVALSIYDRNSLKDSDFGIPDLRKYPLTDENHIRMANKFFNKAPKEHKKELASRILAAAKKFNIDTSNWNDVNSAIGEQVIVSDTIEDDSNNISRDISLKDKQMSNKAFKKFVNEGFLSPINKIKENITQEMDLFNNILKIDMLNKTEMMESLKMIEKPNLKPVMFVGFMDPENVQRTEAKHLIKHIIYVADNDTIYTSFFNSYTRRNEISNIASSMDALMNDFLNKEVKEIHLPAHMKDCMVNLEDGERLIHSRGNIPMKFIYKDGFYLNAYYAYFAIYEAFEFKRNILFKNVSQTILSEFNDDESHFDFEEIEVVQETYGSAKINIRFRHDNEPFICVIPVVAMKTQPASLFHEGSRDEVNPAEEPVQESVMENGLIKVNNFEPDTVYFGSDKDFGENYLKLSNPELFVTPYVGLASIFTTDRRLYNLPRGHYNLAYTEWSSPALDRTFDDIHVFVEGCPNLPDRHFEADGYIYEIDVSDLKDHIYRKQWMDKDKECLICGLDMIKIKKRIPHPHVVYLKGAPAKNADTIMVESLITEYDAQPQPQGQGRLIELAYRGKVPNLTPEQEKLVKDYGNIRDQLYASGEYYKREVKVRKKELKRLQEEYSKTTVDYERDNIRENINKITSEINELTKEYIDDTKLNSQTMFQMADKFDELERAKSQPQTSSSSSSSGGLLSRFINLTDI